MGAASLSPGSCLEGGGALTAACVAVVAVLVCGTIGVVVGAALKVGGGAEGAGPGDAEGAGDDERSRSGKKGMGPFIHFFPRSKCWMVPSFQSLKVSGNVDS